MRSMPVRSFWIGGFEGADHLDAQGRPLDMAAAHGHLQQLDEDYARAAALGIHTVRESIGWRLCETAPGVYDLGRALRMARSARRHGLQILWTLMHYGTPPDLSLMDDALIDRFAAFAAAVAQALADAADEPPVYTLVNEINFLSWAAAHTDMMWPYRGQCADASHSTLHSGYAVKRRLVRATLAATDAVRRVDARARFLQVEPLVHVVAPADRPDLAPLADQVASYQWQAWDLLSGQVEPGLGGSPAMLDLLGINHYHSGQWEVHSEQRLCWHRRDPRRRGLDELLHGAWRRYGCPLLVSETSHVGAGRALWLSDMASQVERARGHGVPVLGLCLYPLVDRPDWSDPQRWHHSGLWDVAPGQGMARLLHRPYARMLQLWQQRLPAPVPPAPIRPLLLVFSHLRWDPVQRRPQHLMAELAAHWRIVFVEEPVHGTAAPLLVRSCPLPGIEVLQPHTPGSGPGFDGDQVAPVAALLRAALGAEALRAGLSWLTTPGALALVQALQLRPTLYDCTQAGPDAPASLQRRRQWKAREAALLREAAQVLVAGPALSRAVGVQRRQLACVFNAVDAEHFAPRTLQPHGSEAHEAARLLAGLDGPLIGYCGTLDARVDLGLLAQLADARPQWRIVLIGPLALPAGTALPQRPNLHWLGAQPYSLLPYLLARLHVALLPYVLGPRTALANPPQLLEYLAARKPVVSVPLPDVLDLYAAMVATATGATGFVQACEAALQRLHLPDLPDLRQHARIDALLASHSWRNAAGCVQALLQDVQQDVQQGGAQPARLAPTTAQDPA